MGKSLIIVESPAKARTIHKILGREFMVKASVGHIKDLPENRLGVDIKRNFTPQYVIIKGKEKVIRELKALSRKAERIYLAPDPDREGEAIAWHIAEEVGDGKEIHRLLIHEVTPRGIREALKNPRELQESLYRAQQARRILDRLVGYKLSPLLWQKVKRGLSAGRVQSVALRLICEREKEIRDFVPQEYWSITAELRHPSSTSPFEARLTRIQSKKAEIPDEGRAQAIISSLRGERFIVERVQRKERRRNPPPPFITSTLQQEASRRLRFSVKKTMAIAQQLYEGVELGELGRVGLITYMRTDSVRIAPEAIEGVRKAIVRLFGEDYLPKGPNRFRSRKGAQEAHEAIRPASFDLPPEKVKPHLSRDQFLLYKLIWDRFLACQMKEALIDQTTVEIKAGECLFTATGHLLKFPGFLIVYEEKGEDEEEGILPPMKEGDELELIELVPKQHFTQPPPRYTESSLVKELEEKGIGRPSTY
ncbi:MAG: type I DNA topoisomerase, partial [Deltaproteobacteria bacterium]